MADEMPSDKAIAREASLQNQARSASQIVTARFAIWFIAGSVPIIVALGGWGGNRVISTLDKAVEKQSTMGEDIVRLKSDIATLISSRITDNRAADEHVNTVEKTLNDRLTAQSNWVQQLSAKLEDLTKYVYQKVR